MKQIFLLSVLALVTLTLSVGAIYQYQHHKNVTEAAVAKAVAQRDEANKAAEAYQLSLKTSVAQVKALAAQKAAVCLQLQTAKLKNPACL